MEETTNPAMEVETPEVETEEVELELEQSTEPEEEYDDLEYEGKTYKVPKELKPGFMMQSDYTKKTQEIAEQRKAIEALKAESESFKTLSEDEFKLRTKAAAMDDKLQQYTTLNWSAIEDDDPVLAQKLQREWMMLKDQRMTLHSQIEETRKTLTDKQQQAEAKEIQKTVEEIKRRIPKWTNELDVELEKYGRSMGLDDNAIKGIGRSAAAYEAIYKSYLYDKAVKKGAAKEAEPLKPVTKVRTQNQAVKDPDKMSTDEWVKWREAQLRRK